MVNLTIDNQVISVPEGTAIIEAAELPVFLFPGFAI